MSSTIQRAYNVVRPHLPRTWQTYAGVRVHDARVLDATLSHPDYKRGLIEAIQEHAAGRHVELVGFGRGVSTVKALEAGAAHVSAYEAAENMLTLGVETLLANGQPLHQVTLHHALVGPAVDVFGDASGARQLDPSRLGVGDVLVIDAEGAELEILEAQDSPPAPLSIVETHPDKGSNAVEVDAKLNRLGYRVEWRDYEPDRADKDVLVGRQS